MRRTYLRSLIVFGTMAISASLMPRAKAQDLSRHPIRLEVISFDPSIHRLAQCQLRERTAVVVFQLARLLNLTCVRSASASSGSKQGQTPERAHP